MKIQHMRKQWIPGPSFFFPARSAPRASLRAKKEGLGTRLAIVSKAGYMFLQAKLHEVRVGPYEVDNQNSIDLLFSMLLMFTNMYTVPMVTVFFLVIGI